MLDATPFVKWTGGKRQLLPELLPLLLDPPPVPSAAYHEPFLGGGAVAFALMNMDPCPFDSMRLSDANRELITTWIVVMAQVEPLIARLVGMKQAYRPGIVDDEARHKAAGEFYYKLRAAKPRSPVATAARFLFLNRTGFNGLYRVNKAGGFNTPWGKNPDVDVVREETLRAASAVLGRWQRPVTLTAADYVSSLRYVRAGDVVYLDPPYVADRAGGFTAYTPGGFLPADQLALAFEAQRLVKLGARVVLSNHDTPTVRDLYQEADGWTLRPVGERRVGNSDATKRGKVSALIIHGGR